MVVPSECLLISLCHAPSFRSICYYRSDQRPVQFTLKVSVECFRPEKFVKTVAPVFKRFYPSYFLSNFVFTIDLRPKVIKLVTFSKCFPFTSSISNGSPLSDDEVVICTWFSTHWLWDRIQLPFPLFYRSSYRNEKSCQEKKLCFMWNNVKFHVFLVPLKRNGI